MLDLLVIVAGFAVGVMVVVAVNATRRGGPLPAAPARAPRAPAPPPPPVPPQGAPIGAGAPGPYAAPGGALADHGIRVNHPGVAAASPAPAPPPSPPPAPAAPIAAAGPSLAKDPDLGAGGARLEVEGSTERIALGEDPVTLGRGTDQVLRVRDTRASRAHAIVRRRSRGRPGWEVADAGSANGTTLNGHLIPAGRVAPLRTGDRIGVGDTTVVYVEAAGDPPPPPPSPPAAAPPDPDATQVQR